MYQPESVFDAGAGIGDVGAHVVRIGLGGILAEVADGLGAFDGGNGVCILRSEEGIDVREGQVGVVVGCLEPSGLGLCGDAPLGEVVFLIIADQGVEVGGSAADGIDLVVIHQADEGELDGTTRKGIHKSYHMASPDGARGDVDCGVGRGIDWVVRSE